MIKKVDKIPSDGRKISQRQQIREDLLEAVNNRVKAFEIEGDYNYEHLAGYVRETARELFSKEVYRKASLEVRKELGAKYGRVFPIVVTAFYNRIGKIYQRKGEDRTHVFVEIDYDFLDNFKQILLEETRKKYATQ